MEIFAVKKGLQIALVLKVIQPENIRIYTGVIFTCQRQCCTVVTKQQNETLIDKLAELYQYQLQETRTCSIFAM